MNEELRIGLGCLAIGVFESLFLVLCFVIKSRIKKR